MKQINGEIIAVGTVVGAGWTDTFIEMKGRRVSTKDIRGIIIEEKEPKINEKEKPNTKKGT